MVGAVDPHLPSHAYPSRESQHAERLDAGVHVAARAGERVLGRWALGALRGVSADGAGDHEGVVLAQWWRRLWREFAGLPYRGASVSIDRRGRVVPHPARTKGEVRRNMARLDDAMKVR